jgi:hypothetical protein
MLEHLTVALDCELSDSTSEYEVFLNGGDDGAFKFGSSANRLMSYPGVRDFEARMLTKNGDNVFRRKDSTKNDPGGFARRLFCELSKYTHGAPGRTEADLWQSNGPIFHPDAWVKWYWFFCKVICTGTLMMMLGRMEQNPSVVRAKELFERAKCNIPYTEGDREGDRSLLDDIADDAIWQ